MTWFVHPNPVHLHEAGHNHGFCLLTALHQPSLDQELIQSGLAFPNFRHNPNRICQERVPVNDGVMEPRSTGVLEYWSTEKRETSNAPAFQFPRWLLVSCPRSYSNNPHTGDGPNSIFMGPSGGGLTDPQPRFSRSMLAAPIMLIGVIWQAQEM